MENSKLQDTSQVARKNVIVMFIAFLVFAVFLTINILRYVELNIFDPVVIFLDIMFIFVIFQRTHPKYLTELDKRGFRITRMSLLGKKVYDIPYRDIAGIYKYKIEVDKTVFREGDIKLSACDKMEREITE